MAPSLLSMVNGINRNKMNIIFLEPVVVLVSIITGTLSQNCNKDEVINDHLGQRRVCHGGKMSAPCRVRREWSGMLPGERYRFIETLKTASARRDFKDLVNKHRSDFDHIHNREQFLWWHRWYLLQMENILRNVDPIITIPYWDWSLWSGAPWLSEVMSTWSEAPWGFGRNGERNKCVHSGPFGQEHWTTTDGDCLKRDFNGNPPDCIAVHKCLRLFAHEFRKFESTLREALHNTMHCRIGGTMCSKNSANAPEFLLHHCFTDKIWADWQKKDPRNKYASLDANIRLYGIRPELKARDLMDLLRQPGGVCVIYDDPPHETYHLCHNTLAKLTLNEIDKIPRQRFTRLSNLEFELFMMESNGRTRATAEMETIEPNRILPKNAKLNPQDSARGFKAEDVEEAVKKRKRELLSGEIDEKNNTFN